MRWPKESTLGWKILYIVAIVIKPFFLRLRVEGEENMPSAGGCLLACNHSLGADYVVLGYASPRQVYYMAKAEIFEINSLLSRIVLSSGAFPVRRGQGDMNAVEQAVKIVKAGHVVGMFPEGTRSRNGGLRRAKVGTARIALAAGVPIVPAVVINGETILGDLFKLQRRPLVTVRFGKPIDASLYANTPEEAQKLTKEMMLSIAELLPPERRGYYADAAALSLEDSSGAITGEPSAPAA